jgi:hypothetical protein
LASFHNGFNTLHVCACKRSGNIAGELREVFLPLHLSLVLLLLVVLAVKVPVVLRRLP